jgi:hypothetical protein
VSVRPSQVKHVENQKGCIFSLPNPLCTNDFQVQSTVSGDHPGCLQMIVRHARRSGVIEPMRLMQPASIPRPLDAVRVRRKPVRRCDRHGQLRATTRSRLWRRIFFSVTKGPQNCQDDGSWGLCSRSYDSPELAVARILAVGLDGTADGVGWCLLAALDTGT